MCTVPDEGLASPSARRIQQHLIGLIYSARITWWQLLDSSWPADSLQKIKSSADKLLTAGFNGLCNYIYTENKHLGYYTKLMQTIMGNTLKLLTSGVTKLCVRISCNATQNFARDT